MKIHQNMREFFMVFLIYIFLLIVQQQKRKGHKLCSNDKMDLNKTWPMTACQAEYVFFQVVYFLVDIRNNHEYKHDHMQHILSCFCEANQ